jgi:uncharacterized protein
LVARGLGPVVTSDLVLGEVWTLTRRRRGHREAIAVTDAIAALPEVSIADVLTSDRAAAWAWLRLHDERGYSFVDATSFAMMRRLDILEALAFDGDFGAAGFVELRP